MNISMTQEKHLQLAYHADQTWKIGEKNYRCNRGFTPLFQVEWQPCK